MQQHLFWRKQAWRWETNLSPKHSVLQFKIYHGKSPKSMIAVMALLDGNYIRQTTWAEAMLWWRNQSPVHHFSGSIHHTSSHRHHQMSARNVGSVCSYGTNSWHMIPCTSKPTSESISYRNKCLCLLQAGRSHVVTCSGLWKEVWMSDISSQCPGMHWCKFVSDHQSPHKAETLTQSITNSIWCQNLTA